MPDRPSRVAELFRYCFTPEGRAEITAMVDADATEVIPKYLRDHRERWLDAMAARIEASYSNHEDRTPCPTDPPSAPTPTPGNVPASGMASI